MKTRFALIFLIFFLLTISASVQERRDHFNDFINQVAAPANPDLIRDIKFVGVGLNDLTTAGTYTQTDVTYFDVEIDGTGSPNTFKWRQDGGAYTTTVAITGAAQTLAEGITIIFAATTGHTLANVWTVTITPQSRWYINSSGAMVVRKWDGTEITAGSGSGSVTHTAGALTANSFVFGNGTDDIKATAAATNGQLLIGSTAANPVAAALTGTAKEITVTNGAGSITLSMAATDGARVTNTALQTFTTGVAAAITFDTEQYDNGTVHDTGSNTSRLTFATAGIYTAVGNVDWAGNATGRRTLSIRLNGSTLIAQTQIAGSTTVTQMQTSVVYKFAATDYVELVGTQNSGGNLDVNATSIFSPMFAAHWISK